jgi:hypothetical protein
MYKEKHGSTSGAFRGGDGEIHTDHLGKRFTEGWVRIGANGEIMGPAEGVVKRQGSLSVFLMAKAQAMSKEERQTIVARKRKADPDPDRRGPAKLVSSKVDAIEPMKVEGLMLAGVDEAAFISDEDIENAMKQWQEEAPAQFKELLEADNAE